MKDRNGGFYYEINNKYPLVEKVLELHPEDKDLLLAMLKQIECGLPLNQLYVDLNNDEYLTNDQEQDNIDIETSLRAMINQQESSVKLDLIEKMSIIEPFVRHPKVVEKLRKEIVEDGK